MLGVDERRLAARLLHLADDVQRDRRFARRFRPVYFDDAPSRHAADAQRHIQRQRPGRHALDLHLLIFAKAHNRALAALLFDLCQRRFERLQFFTAECQSTHTLSKFHVRSFSADKRRELMFLIRIPYTGEIVKSFCAAAGGAFSFCRFSSKSLKKRIQFV